MKSVVFVKKEKGSASLESKAEALRKVGHLAKIIEDPITGGKVKYYTMPAMHDYNLCAEVTVMAGRVVSVRNVPETVLIQFGGF